MLSKKYTVLSKQMFESFSTTLRLNRIFGFFPLKWDKVDSNYVIVRSRGYSIYSVAMITLMVTSCIYCQSRLFKLESYQSRLFHTTAAYVTYTDVTIVLLVSFTSVILTCFKAGKYIDLIDNLKKADNYLMKYHPKDTFLTKLFIAFTLFVLGYDLVIWLKITGQELNVFLLLVYYFPYYYCYYIYVTMELVYWQVVNFIRIRLATVNNCLSDLLHSHSNGCLFTRLDKKKIGNVVDTLKQQQNGGKGAKSLKQVKDMIKAYELLFEATKTVNEGFGLSILIVMLGCLIHLIVTSYCIYSVPITLKTATFMFFVSQSVWMLLHLSRLFLIVEPCHDCLVEIENARSLICQLLNSGYGEEFDKSLNFFLLFMSKCKIEFEAYGLTKIHRGILATIAGAVTTYLVILFQFNSGE